MSSYGYKTSNGFTYDFVIVNTNGNRRAKITSITHKNFFSSLVVPETLVADDQTIKVDYVTIPQSVTDLTFFTGMRIITKTDTYKCELACVTIKPSTVLFTDPNLNSTIKSNRYNELNLSTSGCILNISYGITTIDANAFNGCTGFTNIILPSTLKSIHTSSFYLCGGLKDILVSKIQDLINAKVPIDIKTDVDGLNILVSLSTIGFFAGKMF